jgi:hypothetical protein
MTSASVSRAIQRCGTEQPDVPGRVLTAGPLSVEARQRQPALPARGRRRGAALARLPGARRELGHVRAAAVRPRRRAKRRRLQRQLPACCERAGQAIDYERAHRRQQATAAWFHRRATPQTDFLTARTGFVVLHPLAGVAGRPVEVVHTDGTIERSAFPAAGGTRCSRSSTSAPSAHEVLPGLHAVVRMEGDTFEMEDHRNWTDASFKTYVRPLALPWPYTLRPARRCGNR